MTNDSNWGNKVGSFVDLGPNEILNAIDALGYRTTGRFIYLNSMENRVYQIEVEKNNESEFLVAKFYRPGRWSMAQILEEHEFLNDLYENEIAVVPPISFNNKTLFTDQVTGLYFAIFKRVGGRPPYDLDKNLRIRLGRLIARIHSVGKIKQSKVRLTYTKKIFGENAAQNILNSKYLKAQFKPHVEMILNKALALFLDPKDYKLQRIHGDFHVGNLLIAEDQFRQEQYTVFDFDDFVMGPIVQDIWPLVAMCENEQEALNDVIEGYEEIAEFNYEELKLIPSLKAYRIINLCSWLCSRFEDPSFQAAFPYFGQDEYWQNFIANLYELVEQVPIEH